MISTHSLTRRLTIFNALTNNGEVISTHSLTRRLTRYLEQGLFEVKDFNSQPHKEADKNSRILCANCVYFNSQPHKEADSNFIQ